MWCNNFSVRDNDTIIYLTIIFNVLKMKFLYVNAIIKSNC